MNAIVESSIGSAILVTQTKVNLQITGIATQLFKIKDEYVCLVKLIGMMKNDKYTIKEAGQAIQVLVLDFGEDTCSINH